MKLIETETANLEFDQDGDAYFMANGVANYINEFIRTNEDFIPFDAINHITNTGGMGINIDESNDEVKYSIFTIC